MPMCQQCKAVLWHGCQRCPHCGVSVVRAVSGMCGKCKRFALSPLSQLCLGCWKAEADCECLPGNTATYCPEDTR